MDDLIHDGKILYWGTSEWSAADIMRAHGLAREHGLTPPQMEQPQYNMLHRDRVEKEYLPLYREIGLGTTIWSPLASGLLSGKYNKGVPPGSRATLEGYEWLKDSVVTPQNIAKAKQLEPLTKELGCTMAQLALAWCLKNPNVSTVITGESRPEQVNENMKAAEVAGKIDSVSWKKLTAFSATGPDRIEIRNPEHPPPIIELNLTLSSQNRRNIGPNGEGPLFSLEFLRCDPHSRVKSLISCPDRHSEHAFSGPR